MMVEKREGYFQVPEAEAAFDYLVGLTPKTRELGFDLAEKNHGFLRWALHFQALVGGPDPFGIIINKKSLRFYFRFPNRMNPPLKLSSVIERLPSGRAREQGGGEISVSIFNRQDAERAIRIAFPSLFSHLNPDEIDSTYENEYFEGAVRKVIVNGFERNIAAREICIARWGCACVVCGLDFERMYGERGRGFIHVHHLKPLSEIRQEYRLDPESDLRPVCPNCHAMIHRFDPPLTVEELQAQVKSL